MISVINHENVTSVSANMGLLFPVIMLEMSNHSAKIGSYIFSEHCPRAMPVD